MHASLNEIESLCKKAARGAGMSWGLAEEAGKAAKWLSAHGLDGPQVIAGQLRRDDGVVYSELAPVIGAGAWHGASAALCPLITGAALSDHAYLLGSHGQILLNDVASPQLLIPFVSAMARRLKAPVELSWPGCSLGFDSLGGVFLNDAGGSASSAQSVCAASKARMLWIRPVRLPAAFARSPNLTLPICNHWPPVPTCPLPKHRGYWAPVPD